MSYPNQRQVLINKTPCPGNTKKIIIEKKAYELAKQNLSYTEFYLFIYFASNNQDFIVMPSAAGVGMPANTFRKAFKTLEEKNYLIKTRGTKTKYQFFDIPPY